MKTNQIGILSLMVGVVTIGLIQEAKAEDCVYRSSTWSGGSSHMSNGVYVSYNCYTDSSHSKIASQTITYLNLSQNSGWRLDNTTGNIYNVNNSNLSYTIDTAPKYQETSQSWDKGKQTGYHYVSYYSDGTTKKHESFNTYDNNGYWTTSGTTSYYSDGAKQSEHIGIYSNGKELSANRVEYYSDGSTKKSETSYAYENGKLASSYTTGYYSDGETKKSETSYTYNSNGTVKTYTTTNYDSNGNLVDGLETTYEDGQYNNGTVHRGYIGADNHTMEYSYDVMGSNSTLTSPLKIYDDNGELLAEISLDGKEVGSSGVVLDSKTVTIYDHTMGSNSEKITLEAYDLTTGKLIKKVERNNSGTLDEYTYEYADNGAYSEYLNGSLLNSYNPNPSRTPKRIYTIQEAVEASSKGGKNTFTIRYR